MTLTSLATPKFPAQLSLKSPSPEPDILFREAQSTCLSNDRVQSPSAYTVMWVKPGAEETFRVC